MALASYRENCVWNEFEVVVEGQRKKGH